jgi:hypothetical protein
LDEDDAAVEIKLASQEHVGFPDYTRRNSNNVERGVEFRN